MKIEINTLTESHYLYEWKCCEIITSSNINIDVAWINDVIYYHGNPKKFYSIFDAVFAMYIYYDEGDEWMTQEYNYSEEIRADIAQINGLYDKSDLLRGFQGIADIKNIVSIVFQNDEVRVRNTAGELISIKLAA